MTMTTILTDIEGTTSSIAFVKDVLFPYARRRLPAFVRARGHEPEVRRWLDEVATGHGGICSDEVIVETLQRLERGVLAVLVDPALQHLDDRVVAADAALFGRHRIQPATHLGLAAALAHEAG